MPDKTLERMQAAEVGLTQVRLREVLNYDETTGFFSWRTDKASTVPAGKRAGSFHQRGYRIICLDGRRYREHRLAWLWCKGEFPTAYIDHINGDRSDNRIENLRDVTKAVNQQNLRAAQSNSSTGLLGVRAHSKRKNCFDAFIKVDERRIYLGRFKTAEAAHAAYMTAKRNLHEGCTI